MITEAQYYQFIQAVDPDDIKALWEMPSNPDSFKELTDLHTESKEVLDYFGIPEFSEDSANKLALFMLHLEEFKEEYENRGEYNPNIVEAIDEFLEKAPYELMELAYNQE